MKKILLFNVIAVIFLFVLFSAGCNKIEKIIPPPVLTITSDSIDNITQTSMTCKSHITSDVATDITNRGVCWSIANMPTILDNKTSDGTGLGSFGSKIGGLTENTTYYVRAYATNDFGTSYGNILSFKTLKPFPLNGTVVNDIDNNIYHTIIIGNQVWLQENLKTTKYRNGDAITNFTNTAIGPWYNLLNTQTGVFCNYNNDPALGDIYGRLYNWYVIGDSRGICPVGWHVPTQDEFTELFNYVGGNAIAGGKLKETGTSHWNSPNTGATNVYGFNLLPSGLREMNSEYQNLGRGTYLWASTELSAGGFTMGAVEAAAAGFDYLNQSTGSTWASKIEGFPIRCVMDK